MSSYRVNVLSEYLPYTTKFSALQREQFFECVMEARNFHGGENAVMDKVSETVEKAWNNKHLRLIGQGLGVGLGGMIRVQHAKLIMASKGNDVKESQIGGVEPRKIQPASKRVMLQKKDIQVIVQRCRAMAPPTTKKSSQHEG